MSELLLEELPNINYFTSKSILTKSIPIKSILSRINSTKAEPNTPLISNNIQFFFWGGGGEGPNTESTTNQK